jgi:hypothetical protein
MPRFSAQLRGLAPGTHQILDYENGKQLGPVDSQNAKLKVEFSEHLLLEVTKMRERHR